MTRKLGIETDEGLRWVEVEPGHTVGDMLATHGWQGGCLSVGEHVFAGDDVFGAGGGAGSMFPDEGDDFTPFRLS